MEKSFWCTQWKDWKGSQQKQDKRLEKGRIPLSDDIIRGVMTPEALAIESDRKRLLMAAERPAGHLHRPVENTDCGVRLGSALRTVVAMGS